jgi:hypothetical protein
MGSSVEQRRDEIRRLSRPKVIRQIFNSDLPTFWFESNAAIAIGHRQKFWPLLVMRVDAWCRVTSHFVQA